VQYIPSSGDLEALEKQLEVQIKQKLEEQ